MDIGIAFLIFAMALAALLIFVIKRNKMSRRVRSLLKTHPYKIRTLLNRDKTPKVSDLSKEDRKIITSLSDNDWEEWSSHIIELKKKAQKYPETFLGFIFKNFPSLKDKNGFKKDYTLFMPTIKKVSLAIDNLLLEELRALGANSEETWKKHDDIRREAIKVRQKYPEGFKTYCEINKLNQPKEISILHDRKQIAELQELYVVSKAYDGWEKKQEDFCSKLWKIYGKECPNDGRYCYYPSFGKPTRIGTVTESKFKVWQGFSKCFCSRLLQRQAGSFRSNYDHIAEFAKRTRFFYDRVYDALFKVALKFKETIRGELYIVLMDKCKLNWGKEIYNYHYRRIKENIDSSDIPRINFSELYKIKDTGNISGVFIIDFITSNDEMLNNCRQVVEFFNKSVPFLGYYSLIKEYDEDELIKLAEKHEGYLLKENLSVEQNIEDDCEIESHSEDENIEFVKNLLLQVNKHPFFSYLAIPNTWIGGAHGADITKSKWLNNSKRYIFKTKDKIGFISGFYSVDGGNNSKEISVRGNINNIDDIACFTYILFKEMGIMDDFREHGHKAVAYMNRHGFLASH